LITEPTRELAAPDLVEPVIGFREWRLRGDRLLSQHTDVAWEGETMAAECLPGRFSVHRGPGLHADPSPAPDCACGLYACFEPYRRWASSVDWTLIAGAAALWGRIQVHRSGMRAQYARPVVLALPPRLPPKRLQAAKGVSERLGLPLVRFEHLAAAAEEHGRKLPRSLLLA
jgi:hypothetical protein